MNLTSISRHYSIPFPALQCEQDFEELAKTLHGELTSTDQIDIQGGIAKGVVRRCQVQPGCCVRTWNLNFNHPVELVKRGNKPDHKNCTILFVLTPTACKLKTIGGHEQFNYSDARSGLMVANSVDLHYDVLPFQPVQVIEINANTFWLAQQFRRADLPLEHLLDNIRNPHQPLILTNICSAHVISQVNMLFEALMINDQPTGKMELLLNTLMVDFLNKTLNRQRPHGPANSDAHFVKVLEAEAILKAHLEANLPTVYTIAQQVSLSESTLKRHFKIVFGKSLYEYYLEKKMQLAKDLLQEQPLTVYQAASRLGYEKVSNFIWIFKKHHGYSPGSIKKRGLTSV